MQRSKYSLIIRLPNWVGDVIMALPSIQALADMGINLHLVGKPWIKDLLGGLSLPLYALPNKFGQRTKMIKEIQADNMLLLTNSFGSALMARLALKSPIGYKADFRQWLLTKALKKATSGHEVAYFWRLAEFAKDHWFQDKAWPNEISEKIHLPVASSSQVFVEQILLQEKITQPFIVLCPFAHGTGKNKQAKIWPHWALLSQAIAKENVLVCPGKDEERLCETLVPHAKIIKGLNLSQYAAILAKSDFVVANDSGPMHLASAVNVPTLGLFGVTNPNRTAPWGGDYLGAEGRWPSLDDVLKKISTYGILED